MKRKLMIIGAGGHGKVVADIGALVGYNQIDFLDDQANPAVPTVGTVADYTRFIRSHDFIVAIGNNRVRERITKRLAENGADIVSLVHPAATVGSGVQIGKGAVVMAGAVIHADATIADGAIVNTCSSVDHDCVIGAYAHISVGARIAGTVTIGQRTMVGAGATVINNLTVCDDCMVGAGAVVVKNITEAGTYLGVPAKRK